eukprot:scaffold1593_cov156-Amphora_coffeaeformis.AAC.3
MHFIVRACTILFVLSKGHAWINAASKLELTLPPLTRMHVGKIFGGDKTKDTPALPSDVKEAVTKCRAATQEALKDRVSRMDIEFPVGAKFNVEPQPKRKGASADGTPTKTDLERSDRELARLFVDMFQPVGGEHLAVIFPEMTAAEAAKKKWKGDATAQCRILSLDRRKSSGRKEKVKSLGFAAKLAAEVGDVGSDSVGGPFKLPAQTEVALFVSPGPKELVIVERICEEVGLGTLVVLLNARLSTISNFGTTAATKLFREEFENVFHLAAYKPQDVAPNCLLHRAYPGKWILARKPSVGAPKTILVSDKRPNATDAAQAFDSLEISDIERGMEDAVQNIAGWFK